jgi:PDZ domain-containing protein
MRTNWLKQRRTRVVVLLLAVVVVVSNLVHVGTYELLPGDAQPLAPMISITGAVTDPHPHATKAGFMMVDVSLKQMTVWSRTLAELRGATNMVDLSALVPPGSSFEDFDRQSYLDMERSKEAAEFNAFSALGWDIPPTARGALVNDTTSAGPARRAGVEIADRIVSVNGISTSDSCAAIRILHDLRPGSKVSVGFEHAKISTAGVISYRPVKTVQITTAKPPTTVGIPTCPGINSVAKSWIGVVLSDAVVYNFPATVTIDTNYIGGPSAGLAMSLALIDQLSSGSLSGGRKVAVTGELALNGVVGDIGGIAQKTQAAITAGATVFLVPVNQVGEARRAAQGKLRVVGAYRLTDVLTKLRQMGGDAPIPYTKPNFLAKRL